VFWGVGAEGCSWAQHPSVNVANRLALAASRMVEAKRANGIYSSPIVKTVLIKTCNDTLLAFA
jgi:hypothetical protein